MQNKRVNLLRMALIFVNLVFESFSICCSPCIVFFCEGCCLHFSRIRTIFLILICARRWLATFLRTKSRSLMGFICAFSRIYVFDKSPGPRARCLYIAQIGRTFVSRIAFIRTLLQLFLPKRVSFCSQFNAVSHFVGLGYVLKALRSETRVTLQPSQNFASSVTRILLSSYRANCRCDLPFLPFWQILHFAKSRIFPFGGISSCLSRKQLKITPFRSLRSLLFFVVGLHSARGRGKP